MVLMILGLVIWTGAHVLKRVAPDLRNSMGDKGRAVIAGFLVLSIVLMVLGYRGAEGPVYWGRTAALTGINNLLMLIALYLFASAGAKTVLARRMRHPMLAAVKVWALAHILVNGDLASFVLFGGLLGWAVLHMILINRSEPDWTPPAPAPARKEVSAVVITVVIYALIAVVHGWLGYGVFG